MAKSTLAQERPSSEKRDPGFVKIRRGLLPHLSEMSSHAVKLYLWLHLRAHWKPGVTRGWVEGNYEDIGTSLRWSYSMVRRTLDELSSDGYIVVTPGANQYELTRIKILKFDLEDSDSAVSTGEHTKSENDSALLSGVLSGVSTGEQSTEHTNSSILQSAQGLQVPKKVVEVKKEKKEKKGEADAVRRPFDAKQRTLHNSFFSPSEKKKKLTARLVAKIQKQDDSFGAWVEVCCAKGWEHPFGSAEREAFKALHYEPDLESPLLSFDFVSSVVCVYDEHREKDLSPGILCSKVIDFCEQERKRSRTLDCDGGYYYPPDFVDHRNRLRARERANAQTSQSSLEVRA